MSQQRLWGHLSTFIISVHQIHLPHRGNSILSLDEVDWELLSSVVAAPCVKSLYSTQEQELSLKFPSFTFGSKVVVQIHSGGQRPLKTGELSIQRTSPVVFAIK